MRDVGRLGRSPIRRVLDTPLRAALLAGAAALVLIPCLAHAQEGQELERPSQAAGLQGLLSAPEVPVPDKPKPPKAPAPSDGLGPEDVYLEADLLIDDPQAHTITARGSVEARREGRTIRGR